MAHPLPASLDETTALLGQGDDIAGRDLATVQYPALKPKKPLFVEGEPGTCKSEIAKVFGAALGRRLVAPQFKS